jgi:hypothetical protein
MLITFLMWMPAIVVGIAALGFILDAIDSHYHYKRLSQIRAERRAIKEICCITEP